MANTLVWAHRGASGYAPENTLASFEKALEMDADGIELDIHLTKDGQIVVIHDEQIDRTSNGSGWVKDMTLEELRAFDYNYQNRVSPWNPGEKEQGPKIFPEYEQSDIPTMQEVLDLMKGTGKMINIEIKTGIVMYPIEEQILKLVAVNKMEDQIIYSSFNHYSIQKIKQLNPEAKTGFLYADGPLDMVEYGLKNGVNALHPALYNLQYPGFVQECHAKGLDLNVWTVNSPAFVQQCVAAGVHAVITNYPDMAKEIIQNM